MHTSLRHLSITVERQAGATRRPVTYARFPRYRSGSRRDRGPSLRERIHATLRGGRGRSVPAPA